MRVTKGMINMHGGGLLSGRKSLLSYVKSNRTGAAPGLISLQNKSGRNNSIASVAGARYQKAGYERLGKAADSLESRTGSVGEKADKGELAVSEAESLLASYNDTLKSLYQCDGSLNNFYRQTLKQAATDNLDALREIGISYGSDGTLSLNRSKFGSADAGKIKAVLGSGSGFMRRLGVVAPRVSDSAAANARTASSRYNASGDIGNSYFSKYNFFG